MKDQVHRIEYFALPSSDKPGEGASLHQKLAKEGVNLLAVSAFPAGDGSVQVDLVPENPDAFGKAAKKLGLKLGAPQTAFLFQGTDRAGALSEVLWATRTSMCARRSPWRRGVIATAACCGSPRPTSRPQRARSEP